MKRNYFFIFVFILSLVCMLSLSACSSSQIVSDNTTNQTIVGGETSKPVVADNLPLVASDAKYLVSLNEETQLNLDSKSAILKITGANSNDESVVLSVKQGSGENVKKIKQNQVISFGTLRICVDRVIVDDETGSAQALLVPTYTQKAVSWFSMTVPADVNETCSVFTRAVELSKEKDGAVTFFYEQLVEISDQDKFVTQVYSQLLGKTPDELSLQAWDFYVTKNGRKDFLSVIVASEDFKSHESSIK